MLKTVPVSSFMPFAVKKPQNTLLLVLFSVFFDTVRFFRRLTLFLTIIVVIFLVYLA